MRALKLSIMVISIFFFLGCSSTKTHNNSADVSASEVEHEKGKYLKEGYHKGIIVYSAIESDCKYTIQVMPEGNFFDPINLDDAFKLDGAKVWFSYFPLRMMNRCDKANPISIEHMEMRND